MLAQGRELQDIPETWVQPPLDGGLGMILFKPHRQKNRVALIRYSAEHGTSAESKK